MPNSKSGSSLKPGRAPDHCLTEVFEDLPQGAFLKPIEMRYVPGDTLERLGISKRFHDEERHVVCYTAKGMKLIPRAIIKER